MKTPNKIKTDNLINKSFIACSVFFSLMFILGFIVVVNGASLYEGLDNTLQVTTILNGLTDKQITDNWNSLIESEKGEENANKFLNLLDSNTQDKFTRAVSGAKDVDLGELRLKYENKQLKTKEGTPIVPNKKLDSIKVTGDKIKSIYVIGKEKRSLTVTNGEKGYVENNNFVRDEKILANVLGYGGGGDVEVVSKDGNTKFDVTGKDAIVGIPEKTEQKIPAIFAYGGDKKGSVQVDSNGLVSDVSGRVLLMRMGDQKEIPTMFAGKSLNIEETRTAFFDTGEKSVSLIFGSDKKVDGDFIKFYNTAVNEKGDIATNILISASGVTMYPMASMSSVMSINDITLVDGKSDIRIISQSETYKVNYPEDPPSYPKNVFEKEWQTFVSFNGKDIWVPNTIFPKLSLIEEIKTNEGDGYNMIQHGNHVIFGFNGPVNPNPGWELTVSDSKKLQGVLDNVYNSGSTDQGGVDIYQLPQSGPKSIITKYKGNLGNQLKVNRVPSPGAPASPGSGSSRNKGRVGGILFFPAM